MAFFTTSLTTGPRTCLLCSAQLPYPPNSPIGVLDQLYASTLCKLLSLPESENGPLFQNGLYCSSCFQVINDIHHKLNNLLTLWASVNVTRNFIKQMLLSPNRNGGTEHHLPARHKIATSLQQQRYSQQQQQHQHQQLHHHLQHQQQQSQQHHHSQSQEFVLDEIASFLNPQDSVTTTTYDLSSALAQHGGHGGTTVTVHGHQLTDHSSLGGEDEDSSNGHGGHGHSLGTYSLTDPQDHHHNLGHGPNDPNKARGTGARGGRGGGRGRGKKAQGANNVNATGAGASPAGPGRKKPPAEPKKPKGPPKPVPKKFKCHLCGEEFYQRSSLAIHERMHTQKTALLHTCKHCGTNLTNKLQIDLHNCPQMRELPSRLPREQPPEPPEIIEAHKKNSWEALNMNPTDTICDHCSKDLKSPSKLRTHLIMIHGLGAKPYKCEECSKEFLYVKNLTLHIKQHGRKGKGGARTRGRKGRGSWVCELCEKSFRTKASYGRHKRSHEEGELETFFDCPSCGKEFRSKENLEKHVLLHRPRAKGRIHHHQPLPQSQDQEILPDLQIQPLIDEATGEIIETLDVKPVILRDGSLGVSSTTSTNNSRRRPSSSSKKSKAKASSSHNSNISTVSIAKTKKIRALALASLQNGGGFHNLKNLVQKYYLCFICNDEFSDKLYLKRHMLKHNVKNEPVPHSSEAENAGAEIEETS